MYENPKAASPTIPETDTFYGITSLEEDHRDKGQPFFGECYNDDEQQAYPTFDRYKDTDQHDSEQSHPLVPIYQLAK